MPTELGMYGPCLLHPQLNISIAFVSRSPCAKRNGNVVGSRGMLLGSAGIRPRRTPTSDVHVQLPAGANSVPTSTNWLCTHHVLTCCFVPVWLIKAFFSFDVAIEVMTELVSQYQVSSVLLYCISSNIYCLIVV